VNLGKYSGYSVFVRWCANATYDVLRALAWVVSRKWKHNVFWHAPLPEGPVLLAVNHPTSLDPFVIALVAKRRLVFLTSYKLFGVPVFGKLLRAAGMISAGEGSPKNAYRDAVAALQQGYTLCVFPEGRISPGTGEIAHLRSGAARIALGADVAVVPVGIYAPAENLRLLPVKVNGRDDHIRWYERGPYAITVGEAMKFSTDGSAGMNVRRASQQIANRIAELAAEGRARVLGDGPMPATPRCDAPPDPRHSSP